VHRKVARSRVSHLCRRTAPLLAAPLSAPPVWIHARIAFGSALALRAIVASPAARAPLHGRPRRPRRLRPGEITAPGRELAKSNRCGGFLIIERQAREGLGSSPSRPRTTEPSAWVGRASRPPTGYPRYSDRMSPRTWSRFQTLPTGTLAAERFPSRSDPDSRQFRHTRHKCPGNSFQG
jgi:hypothetical protein